MATKKQKRQAALAKREAFLAAERERNAKNLEKSRSKRADEAAKHARQESSAALRKNASKKAKKLPRVNTRPHDDGHDHVTQGVDKKCLHCGYDTEAIDLTRKAV